MSFPAIKLSYKDIRKRGIFMKYLIRHFAGMAVICSLITLFFSFFYLFTSPCRANTVEESRFFANPYSEGLPTLIDVPFYSQLDILPTGCETVSAYMLLEYYGCAPSLSELVSSLDKADFSYLPDGTLAAPSPDEAYIGDPWTDKGYGCYPPVIVRLLSLYLPDPLQAVDMSGTSMEDLTTLYTDQGIPALVWTTMYMKETYPSSTWQLLDEHGECTGETFTWMANEHCMVLIGCDDQFYYFNDPLQASGVTAYEKELFKDRYESMGMRCVVIR